MSASVVADTLSTCRGFENNIKTWKQHKMQGMWPFSRHSQLYRHFWWLVGSGTCLILLTTANFDDFISILLGVPESWIMQIVIPSLRIDVEIWKRVHSEDFSFVETATKHTIVDPYMNTLANLGEEHENVACCFWSLVECLLNSWSETHRRSIVVCFGYVH